MSKNSAQCDELRAMAESVGLAMPQAATLMMEATDTILSLRDKAQDLQSENVKLRAARDEWAENDAKLRELVRDLYLCSDETCTDCEHHDYSGNGFWCKRGVGWKRARMRELGVEVDR